MTSPIAIRDGAVLRLARGEDLEAVDRLTVEGYRAIQESYVSMIGAETYEAVRQEPELSWEERKCAQNRRLFARHPEQVWVLEREGDVLGFVTFWLFPEQSYGHIDNNAVRSDLAGQGWATFMYRHVLDRFRELASASRTSTPGSTTRTSRHGALTRPWASTMPCPMSTTGRISRG